MKQGEPPALDDVRAVVRYNQIRSIEIEVGRTEEQIKEVSAHLSEVSDSLTELREKKKGLLASMREAARDEGELLLLPFEVAAPAPTTEPPTDISVGRLGRSKEKGKPS